LFITKEYDKNKLQIKTNERVLKVHIFT